MYENDRCERREPEEIEVTEEMLDAGEDSILGEVGGADLGGLFSARDLALLVYRAMHALHRTEEP